MAESGVEGTHGRAVFSFVEEQRVPASAPTRVGREGGVGVLQLFPSQGSTHPTLQAARPRKGVNVLLEGSKGASQRSALGFLGWSRGYTRTPTSMDLEVLSDESFVVIVSIPSS